MHLNESEIWNFIRLLSKIDDGEAAVFANAAADNLRGLVETGIFDTLAGSSLALMHVISDDPAMREPDRTLAKVLLTAFDPGHGYALLSKPQISIRTGFSVSKVRLASKRLVETGYFIAIAPTDKETADGDFVIRYRPNFDATSPT